MSLGYTIHRKVNYVSRTLLSAAELNQCETLPDSKIQVHQNKRKGREGKGKEGMREKKKEIKKEDGEKEEEEKEKEREM